MVYASVSLFIKMKLQKDVEAEAAKTFFRALSRSAALRAFIYDSSAFIYTRCQANQLARAFTSSKMTQELGRLAACSLLQSVTGRRGKQHAIRGSR
jgi:hypothetical protein